MDERIIDGELIFHRMSNDRSGRCVRVFRRPHGETFTYQIVELLIPTEGLPSSIEGRYVSRPCATVMVISWFERNYRLWGLRDRAELVEILLGPVSGTPVAADCSTTYKPTAMDGLRAAIVRAKLTRLQREVVELIAENGGQARIADVEKRMTEGSPLDAFKRAKPKLMKEGWILSRFDNCLVANPNPKPRSKK